MDASTPRLAGRKLRFLARTLAMTPLPRLLSRMVFERKLKAIDFAAEGEPAPFYIPPPWTGK